jgi:transcriptional regulator with XRE-family HTH domain
MEKNHKSAKQLQEFGNQVRKYRSLLGISQEKLAELSGLHRTYIGHVERGEVNISLLNLFKISKALKITAEELVRGL